MLNYKGVSIREVNGGWIVDTGDGEFVYTNLNAALRKVKETFVPKEETPNNV